LSAVSCVSALMKSYACMVGVCLSLRASEIYPEIRQSKRLLLFDIHSPFLIAFSTISPYIRLEGRKRGKVLAAIYWLKPLAFRLSRPLRFGSLIFVHGSAQIKGSQPTNGMDGLQASDRMVGSVNCK